MDPLLTGYIVEFDHWLFQQINGEYTSKILDILMPVLTDLNHQKWIAPLILVLFGFWIAKKRTIAIAWILVLIVSVGVSDFVSYRVVKSTANRARPEQAGVPVVLRTNSHSGSSFPSNHAANAFAGASILSAAFPPFTPLAFLIAFLIAYSRVYVGVHFPLDVVAGALLGWAIAFTVRLVMAKVILWGEMTEAHRLEKISTDADKARRKELLRRK